MVNDSGVCSITVQGEEIGLRFGMPANRMIIEKMAQDEDMLVSNKIDEKGIAWLIYAGYVNECLAKDLKPIKKPGDFFVFVEECLVKEGGEEMLTNVADIYAQSKFTKKSLKQINDATEAIKKKMISTGTRSNPLPTESLDLSQETISA